MNSARSVAVSPERPRMTSVAPPDVLHDPALRAQQDALAAHIRDPENVAAPAGVEERRLKIYRELFFNNVEGLLAGNFPVLRRNAHDALDLGMLLQLQHERRHFDRFRPRAENGHDFNAFAHR